MQITSMNNAVHECDIRSEATRRSIVISLISSSVGGQVLLHKGKLGAAVLEADVAVEHQEVCWANIDRVVHG